MQTLADVGFPCLRGVQSVVQAAVRPWSCPYLLYFLLHRVYVEFEKNQVTDVEYLDPCDSFHYDILRKHVHQGQSRSHDLHREGPTVWPERLGQYNHLSYGSISALQNRKYQYNPEED